MEVLVDSEVGGGRTRDPYGEGCGLHFGSQQQRWLCCKVGIGKRYMESVKILTAACESSSQILKVWFKKKWKGARRVSADRAEQKAICSTVQMSGPASQASSLPG